MDEREIKLGDAEIKVMNVLWSEGECTAKHISDVLAQRVGWNMNTTYTLIKRCIKKGAIERSEPNFMCRALISRDLVRETETNELLDKLFDGSADKLFAALVGRKNLSPEQLAKLKKSSVISMLIEMTLSGAAMILFITLIRAVFLYRLPKKAFVAMWELAILRLLLPVKIPSVFSVFTRLGQLWEITPSADAAVNGNGYLEIPKAPNADIPVWEIVWLVGSVFFAALFIGLYTASLRKYRFAERLEWSAVLPEYPKLRRSFDIRVCKSISSPLTYGVIKPVILLPKAFDAKKAQSILAHELVHIKRLDILRKIAAVAAVCVHWANPFVWILFVLYNRDIELVCDEEVTRRFDRREYALALVDALDGSAGVLHNHFGGNAVEERITALAKRSGGGLLPHIAACFLTLCVTAIFAVSALGGKRLDEIAGYERIFDGAITRVKVEDESGSDMIVAGGQPFVLQWARFLRNAELRKTDGYTPTGSHIVTISTADGDFPLRTDGRTLTLGGDCYEFRSVVPIPLDKTLYPFGEESVLIINTINIEKE